MPLCRTPVLPHVLPAAICLTLLSFASYAGMHGSYQIAGWLAAMIAMSAAVAWASWRGSGHYRANAIIGWAIAMRVIAAFTPAFFEDDYFRFLWDGYRTLVDGNPYAHAPADYFATFNGSPALQEVLSSINHPQVATIYGPALQHCFALAAVIDPGALWPWKMIVCIVDMGVVALLVRTFGQRALLYAWSPLVVHEIAVAAHPDGLLGALLLLAFLAARRRQLWWLAVFVGTAAAMKVHTVLALPFLLLAAANKLNARFCLGALAAISVYAIHWIPYLDGFANAWQSFATFAREWQFNALGFSLFSWLPSPIARVLSMIVTAALIVAAWAWQFRYRAERLATALVMAFGALLFFSPVINPWYLLWLLPLACAPRLVTPWAAASLLPLSYASNFNLDIVSAADGHLPVWVSAAQWVVIAVALVLDRQHQLNKNVTNIGGAFQP